MQNIDTKDELQSAIQVLESKQKEDLISLKKELNDFGEQIKPANLIKEGISQISHSPEIKKGLIVLGTGIVSGFVVYKLMTRKGGRSVNYSHSILKDTVSRHVRQASFSLLQYVLAAVISRNSDKIKRVALNLINSQKNKSNQDHDKRA